MKIDGVVVLYNPEDSIYENILSSQKVLSKLFVIDNSTSPNIKIVEQLKKLNNVEYVSLNGNQGIGKALKVGLELAVEDGADYCLTIDQDSVFPSESIDKIEAYLKDNREYAIIATNYNGDDKETGLKEVLSWITSGNFINIDCYKQIKGFKEELFIDWVDFDLCEQFYSIGKKIAYIKEISIKHAIGEPTVIKILPFLKVTVDNHPAVRYYYYYRNFKALYKGNKKFYKDFKRKVNKSLIIQYCFSKNRKENRKMIKRGLKDAKRGVLGPYKED